MAGKFTHPNSPLSATPAPQANKLSPSSPEGRLEAMLEAYAKVLSGRTVGLASQKESGKLLLSITTFFLANVSDATFKVLWDFHKANKDTVCREDRALVGIKQIADPKVARKVLVVYNTFRAFIMGYKPVVSEQEFTQSVPDHILYHMFGRAR